MGPEAADAVKILAEPISVTTCTFTVDRPVHPQRSYYFGSREQAQGSRLAEQLFAIEGVASVLISHDRITIMKDVPGAWQVLGKTIGGVIRSHVLSGEPGVSEDTWKNLPPTEEIRKMVQEVIDREINPAVAAHGGVISLLDVRDNVVYLQMGGGCQGCGMADVTLKLGVEQAIRERVPQVGDILDVTDHAAGSNPFH